MVHIIPYTLQHLPRDDYVRCAWRTSRTISIAGRTITNLRFADDIDGLAGSEQEPAQLVERIDQTSRAYGMEIKAEKTKPMTNNINGIHKEIKASGQKLQPFTNFKYLGAIISDAGSKAEILSRIAQFTTTMTRLKPIWNDQNITLSSKVRLMRNPHHIHPPLCLRDLHGH